MIIQKYLVLDECFILIVIHFLKLAYNITINPVWNRSNIDALMISFTGSISFFFLNPRGNGFIFHFRFEKMISGMYMGEVTRLVLAHLTREGLLFDGIGPEMLFEPGQFFTKYVSEIERCVIHPILTAVYITDC